MQETKNRTATVVCSAIFSFLLFYLRLFLLEFIKSIVKLKQQDKAF